MNHHVIGVVGASGGLGTSTLAVAVAVRAAAQLGPVACVDADAVGGGLDVTACLEHLPGLRWPDLDRARGDLDGAALLESLPQQRSVALLSGRGDDPAGPGPALLEAVLKALRHACALTVLDLGRSLELSAWCTSLVLVAGTSARHLADADALAGRAMSSTRTPSWLALRPGPSCPVHAEDVAVQLDLPLGAVVRHDPRAPRDADRAAMPGTTASASRRAADELLGQVGLLDGRRVRAARQLGGSG